MNVNEHKVVQRCEFALSYSSSSSLASLGYSRSPSPTGSSRLESVPQLQAPPILKTGFTFMRNAYLFFVPMIVTPHLGREELLWEPNSDRMPEHAWCRGRARPGRRR